MIPLLIIKNLHATIEGKNVLNGVNLTINPGEVHAIMGPNGSGKSSLALTLMGHPAYRVTNGSIIFQGQNITTMKPEQRARLGLFLSFQNPVAVPGISIANLTRTAFKNIHAEAKVDIKAFRAQINETLATLHRQPDFLDRSVNDGFSGGEKKMSEVLQFAMLKPTLAIFDEVDSGLDIDALKRIAQTIKSSFDGSTLLTAGKLRMTDVPQSILLITHYQRILNYIEPDHIHILTGGKIVRSGGKEIAHELERSGYDDMKTLKTNAAPHVRSG